MSVISRNKGFTLLEVLIAVTLLGILSGALYGSYFGVVRARERATEGMESRRELGATLDLIRREVSSAVYSRNDKSLRLVVEDRDNFGVPWSTLEMTSLAPPADLTRGQSGIVAIRYQMVDKDNKRTLTRQELDLAFEGPAAVPAYPQMERISAFLVECYDGSKWVRSWDTTINGGLPKSLKVTVQVDEDGQPVEFSTIATPRMSGS